MRGRVGVCGRARVGGGDSAKARLGIRNLLACLHLLASPPFSSPGFFPPSPRLLLLSPSACLLFPQVGLLTKLTPVQPLERSTERAAYPIDDASGCGGDWTGSSDLSKHYLARLHLELPDGTSAVLAVLGLHFKAIPTDPRSCHKREAQATIAQALLSTALAETPYVIAMGDLNDFDGDECCRDAGGSVPTSRVLRMLKDPRSTGSDELHSVIADVAVEDRYTDWWDHAPSDGVDNGPAEHSSLDHMLVSSKLYRCARMHVYPWRPDLSSSSHPALLSPVVPMAALCSVRMWTTRIAPWMSPITGQSLPNSTWLPRLQAGTPPVALLRHHRRAPHRHQRRRRRRSPHHPRRLHRCTITPLRRHCHRQLPTSPAGR